MSLPLTSYLTLSSSLFLLGVGGLVLNRRNILLIFMSIELMLLGVNLNFIIFSVYLDDLVGQVFALLILTVAAAEAGGVPGAESSFLKIMGTELRQEITDLFRLAAGPHALPFLPEQLAGDFDGDTVGPEFAGSVASRYFNFRKLSIFGGSNEIQKNIISKMILGL